MKIEHRAKNDHKKYNGIKKYSIPRSYTIPQVSTVSRILVYPHNPYRSRIRRARGVVRSDEVPQAAVVPVLLLLALEKRVNYYQARIRRKFCVSFVLCSVACRRTVIALSIALEKKSQS